MTSSPCDKLTAALLLHGPCLQIASPTGIPNGIAANPAPGGHGSPPTSGNIRPTSGPLPTANGTQAAEAQAPVLPRAPLDDSERILALQVRPHVQCSAAMLHNLVSQACNCPMDGHVMRRGRMNHTVLHVPCPCPRRLAFMLPLCGMALCAGRTQSCRPGPPLREPRCALPLGGWGLHTPGCLLDLHGRGGMCADMRTRL